MPFERLNLTQPLIASRLDEEFSSSSLPQSILFHGPSFSSRLTAAMELALTLGGEEEKYTRLDSANLIVISNRDSQIRLRAMKNLASQQKNRRSMDNLVHETGILLSSYHSALFTNSDKDAFTAAGDLSDILYDRPEEYDDAWMKAYSGALEKLLSKRKKSSAFTIDQIRAIQTFLQQNEGQNKTVVLENIEDVTVGAMNSILKILEEPPKGAYIILVSRNAGRILETILSRVRQYEFPQISKERQKNLLSTLFFDSSHDSIEDFIYSSSGLDMTGLVSRAEELAHLTLVRHRMLDSESLAELCSFLEEYDCHDIFISRLLSIVEDGFLQGKIDNRRSERILSFLSSASSDAKIYSQNRRTMLERIQRGLADL